MHGFGLLAWSQLDQAASGLTPLTQTIFSSLSLRLLSLLAKLSCRFIMQKVHRQDQTPRLVHLKHINFYIFQAQNGQIFQRSLTVLVRYSSIRIFSKEGGSTLFIWNNVNHITFRFLILNRCSNPSRAYTVFCFRIQLN